MSAFPKRSHWCGELRREHIGAEVVVNGWVHTIRRMGRITFILVRDRTGVVQVVMSSRSPYYGMTENLTPETVVAVKGVVRARPPAQVNPELPTGEVEVELRELVVLSKAKPLPIPVFDPELMKTTSESMRLRYRYLDLRRPEMQSNLIFRAKLIKTLRELLDSRGFIEVETPYLARSTPEGARDFLVPSRLYPGKFYALTQSPQLFKQLLMIAGFERYYQFARCFRDEDPRADRQPEFTQLDIEMSFVTKEDVMKTVEDVMREAFIKTLNVELPNPLPRLTYSEALRKYGVDKPDLRFGNLLEDADERVRTLLNAGPRDSVRVLRFGINERGVEEVGKLIEGLLSHEGGVRHYYVIRGSGILAGGEASVGNELLKLLDVGIGEAAVVAVGNYEKASETLGTLRNSLGRYLGLVKRDEYAMVWITEFPLFELNEEGALTSKHHPFTSPRPEDLPKLEAAPLDVIAQSYDLVLNGYEVGGGSIRINSRELQERVFKILGLSADEMNDRYGFLLEALDYGAPPHGGIAIGVDRLTAVALGHDSIREVIAFPKNKEMMDPMTGAPGRPPEEHLREIKWLRIADHV
ncbi:MAG: aspartate--tRNA ligase [Zestosphaera sp.]